VDGPEAGRWGADQAVSAGVRAARAAPTRAPAA